MFKDNEILTNGGDWIDYNNPCSWMLSYKKINIAGKESGFVRLDYYNGIYKIWSENDFLNHIKKLPNKHK